MKKIVSSILLMMSMLILVGSMALAKPTKAADQPKCPACKMTLTTHKTKANTRAVKIKGKTYYCCAHCNMSSSKTETTAKHKPHME